MSSVPASPPSPSTVPKTTESNSRFHLSIYKQGGDLHGCRPVYLSAMSGHKHQFANNHSLMHHSRFTIQQIPVTSSPTKNNRSTSGNFP